MFDCSVAPGHLVSNALIVLHDLQRSIFNWVHQDKIPSKQAMHVGENKSVYPQIIWLIPHQNKSHRLGLKRSNLHTKLPQATRLKRTPCKYRLKLFKRQNKGDDHQLPRKASNKPIPQTSYLNQNSLAAAWFQWSYRGLQSPCSSSCLKPWPPHPRRQD